jgi:cobaltochelatase CobN
MLQALNGGAIVPAPGGDPVLNPNVLPTGRNMYSINAEMTPTARAWEEGKRLAETSLELYKNKHGDYPRKVAYTFWAGEYITTEGATLAQAFRMLGVEPVRDRTGHVVDIALIPASELRRPRVNVVVQVSGQLRDIAASALQMLTRAIRLASTAGEETYPNYVASGTRLQEKTLIDQGVSPKDARDLSVMRIFGPLNSGYSTGMLGYTESAGYWDQEQELAEGYLNNMGATYGDDEHWGHLQKGLFASALTETDLVVQPRQSNTWGPISLDHVYEFMGGLSLTVQTLTGKEPEALLADYRNRNNKRMQRLKEAVAVEARATILNPVFIQERMKGEGTTAEMFGEIFRNIFGWNVMRPSAVDRELFQELYRTYVLDEHRLGVHAYFDRVNAAAFQSMLSVLLESARRGYWKATDEQIGTTASLLAQKMQTHGAACTEFVCDNEKLHAFIASQLPSPEATSYHRTIRMVRQAGNPAEKGNTMVLAKENTPAASEPAPAQSFVIRMLLLLSLFFLVFILLRRKKKWNR